MIKEKEIYPFTNVNLGAVFWLNDVPISSENRGGIVVFTVPKTEVVLKLIDDFNNDCLVPVKRFVTALQEIKRKMYQKRGQAR